MLQITRKLTYTNIAATLALVVALSGTSYALIITSGDIKNGTIKGTDIANGSLKLPELSDETKNQLKEKGFMFRRTQQRTIGQNAENQTRIATLDLPPGRYVVNGSFTFTGGIFSPEASSYDMVCEMGDPVQQTDIRIFERYRFELPSHVHWTTLVPMTFVGKVDGDGLAVNCWVETPQNEPMLTGSSSDSFVAGAVQVDTLNKP